MEAPQKLPRVVRGSLALHGVQVAIYLLRPLHHKLETPIEHPIVPYPQTVSIEGKDQKRSVSTVTHDLTLTPDSLIAGYVELVCFVRLSASSCNT